VNKLFFNSNTGELVDVSEDKWEEQEQFMIPLLKKPNKNCKKCYGRMYIGRHARGTLNGIVNDYYMPCNSCLRKCLDREYMERQMQDVVKSATQQQTQQETND